MAPRKHEHGPPMDLVNMRRQGVRSLIAYSLDSLWLAGATVDGGGHEGAKIMLTNNHTNPRTSAIRIRQSPRCKRVARPRKNRSQALLGSKRS
jgi:hypothetical protein